MSLYTHFLRPLLFKIEAEKSHDLTIKVCEIAGKVPVSKTIIRSLCAGRPSPVLRTSVSGMTMQSPVALGAGFDKNGRALSVLSSLGFGAIEIGAVSMEPCSGNKGCRAVRLESEDAVLTRYGVPNDGIEKVLLRFSRHANTVPTGINVIWNSSSRPGSPIQEVVADMAAAIDRLRGRTDYATVNFACPNIKGESHFDSIDNARILFDAIDAVKPQMPIFLKFRHRDDSLWMSGLVDLSKKFPWVKGFIPIAHVMRPMGMRAGAVSADFKGSLSGAPLKDQTIKMVKLWFSAIDRERHVIVATGGISTAQDVFEALAAGATFVQIYTVMIYRGPRVVRHINRELAGLMRQRGMTSTAELIGSDCGLVEMHRG